MIEIIAYLAALLYVVLTVYVMFRVLRYIKERGRADFENSMNLAAICKKNGDKEGAKYNYNAALYYLGISTTINADQTSHFNYTIKKALKELEA